VLELKSRGRTWHVQGGSSIGRVAVSKTVGWGFESLPPCQPSLEAKRRAKVAALEPVFEVGTSKRLDLRVAACQQGSIAKCCISAGRD
jgi:hypothetical protein